MVRAETERVPKEHYPIVLCALRSALSDTATTHPRKIIGAIQCIGRPPQGESVTAADYQQPDRLLMLSEVTVLLCSVSWGGETRRLSLKNSTALPAVAAGRRRGVWWSHSVRMVGGVGGLAWVQLT